MLFILQNNQCYTGDQLLSVFKVPATGISLDKFKEVCPSLIQQQLSANCKSGDIKKQKKQSDRPTDAERMLAINLVFFNI